MDIITEEFVFTDADGAQTNFALVTVGATDKIAVTMIDAVCDNANSVDVSVRIGFAAATLSAVSTSGVEGIILSHGGIAPGSGIIRGNGSGTVGVGADGEDLRITSEDPVGGRLCVTVSYYIL
jgi:hypothetical protein